MTQRNLIYLTRDYTFQPDISLAVFYDPLRMESPPKATDPLTMMDRYFAGWNTGNPSHRSVEFETGLSMQGVFDSLHFGYDLCSRGGIREVLHIFELKNADSERLLDDLHRLHQLGRSP